MNPFQIAVELYRDKTITIGSFFSVPTFLGGITLADADKWIGFYATCVGAIGTTLVVIYTALKISRMVGDKQSRE
jgi:hypothetical protein